VKPIDVGGLFHCVGEMIGHRGGDIGGKELGAPKALGTNIDLSQAAFTTCMPAF
jgi:hypothetical protein